MSKEVFQQLLAYREAVGKDLMASISLVNGAVALIRANTNYAPLAGFKYDAATNQFAYIFAGDERPHGGLLDSIEVEDIEATLRIKAGGVTFHVLSLSPAVMEYEKEEFRAWRKRIESEPDWHESALAVILQNGITYGI